MTNSEAMNQIEAGLRALFDNFVSRVLLTQPESADQIKATAGEILAGAHGLIFQIEVNPVAGIALNCGIAPDKDIARLVRIFDGYPMAVVQQDGLANLQ